MLTAWVIRRLDPDFRVWHRLWSFRIAAFWAVVCGTYLALPAFQGYVSPFVMLGLCIVFSLAICIARLTNQPGLS